MFFKNHWKKILFIFTLILALVPFLILFGEHYLNGGLFSEADNGDWLGFWGGYLGSILSIIGVYSSLVIQFQYEKNQKIKDEQRKRLAESYYKIASLIRGVSAGLNTNYVLFDLKKGFVNKYYRDKLRDEITATIDCFIKFRNDYNSTNFIFDYESDDKEWLDSVNEIDKDFATQVLSKSFIAVLGRLNSFENSLSINENVDKKDLNEIQKISLTLLSDEYQLSIDKIISFINRYNEVIEKIKVRINELYE